MQKVIKDVEREYLSSNAEVEFSPGDTVSVSFKIQEGDKSRIQIFQGVVIQKSGTGLGASFTVRKPSGNNIYVERIFPIHSPLVQEIKCVKKGLVRRAKLFYLRGRTGKATRIKEKK